MRLQEFKLNQDSQTGSAIELTVSIKDEVGLTLKKYSQALGTTFSTVVYNGKVLLKDELKNTFAKMLIPSSATLAVSSQNSTAYDDKVHKF